MVRPVKSTQGIGIEQAQSTAKATPALESKNATGTFMVARGNDLLGAGKPHTISKQPPHGISNRVSTLAGTLSKRSGSE